MVFSVGCWQLPKLFSPVLSPVLSIFWGRAAIYTLYALRYFNDLCQIILVQWLHLHGPAKGATGFSVGILWSLLFPHRVHGSTFHLDVDITALNCHAPLIIEGYVVFFTVGQLVTKLLSVAFPFCAVGNLSYDVDETDLTHALQGCTGLTFLA